MRGAVEKSSLHSVLPCPFRGRLPILLCHTYDAIPVCKKDRGLRSGWRCGSGIFPTYPLYGTWVIHPPIPSFRAQSRNLPCTLLFLASFAKGFPFSAVSHTALYRCARKIPRLRSGWRCVNTVPSHFPSTFPVITIRAKRHQHSQRFYFLCAAPHPWTRQPEPWTHNKKAPAEAGAFFVSERLICQTVRAWCLLLLQYQ